MSQTCSPSTQRRYGLARVCRMWEVARSTVYVHQARAVMPAPPPRRRGPKPRWSDEVLLERIRGVLAAAPFLGEGQRKVWARVRWQAGGADVEGPRPASSSITARPSASGNQSAFNSNLCVPGLRREHVQAHCDLHVLSEICRPPCGRRSPSV